MPNFSDAQETGARGELWFEFNLPPKWLLQPPKTDVGIDGTVVICDSSNLNGLEFRVQIKSSKQWKRRNRSRYVLRLKTATIKYWFSNPLPLLLVFYDAKSQTADYAWHDALASEVDVRHLSSNREVTVTIRASGSLDSTGWKSVGGDVEIYYDRIAEALREARTAFVVRKLINKLVQSLKALNEIQHLLLSCPNRTEEQKMLIGLTDLVSHRDAVLALKEFKDTLPLTTPAVEVIERQIRSYQQIVSSYASDFDAEKMREETTAVWINEEVRDEVRPILIGSLLDSIDIFSSRIDA